MSRSPTGIEGWTTHLSGLAPEVAGAVKAWLPRLASLVGPLAPRAAEPGGEPDGYRGLDRRAAWHRLPPTAWLLASEAPDEFLRRAAMAEHLFYDLERRQPAGQRSSLVLFDAGPDSLGAPRIAHLAMLLVFAARAEAAGADLRWSVLQDPDTWRTGAGPEDIKALLGARTSNRVPLDLAAWGIDPLDADVWVVGAPRLADGLPAGVGGMAVSEPLTLGDPVVTVTRHARGAPTRSVDLPLPAPGTRARILTRPFPTPAAPPSAKGTPPSTRFVDAAFLPGFRFNASSFRLLGEDVDGQAMAVRIPVRQKRRQWVSRRAIPDGFQLVAVDWNKRGLFALVAQGTGWKVLNGRGWTEAEGTTTRPLIPPDRELEQPIGALWPIPAGEPRQFHTVDGEGRFWSLAGGSRRPFSASDDGVFAASRPSGRIALIQAANDKPGAPRLLVGQPLEALQAVYDLPVGTTRAWLGYGFGGLPEQGLAVQADRRDEVHLRTNRYVDGAFQWDTVRLSGAPRIWGVTADPKRPARTGVLVGGGARRFLRVEGREGLRMTIRGVEGRVLWACTAPSRPLIAWLEEDGTTRVFDLASRRIVLVARPGGAP